jgi:phosphoglycerate-specific signal transduction histidine kinase
MTRHREQHHCHYTTDNGGAHEQSGQTQAMTPFRGEKATQMGGGVSVCRPMIDAGHIKPASLE